MTGVLVWKEMREQWTSAVALVVLGVGLLIGIHVWSEPSSDVAGDTAAGIVLPLILTWLCGLVAGAQPFAVEYENGTMTWLDALPISRRRIWLGKTLGATAVLFLQVALIVGLAGWLGFLRSSDREPVTGLILLFAFSGLAFGVLGSALGASALAAIGWALFGQILALISTMVVATIFTPLAGNWLAARLVELLPALAAFFSYRVFARPDRLRRPRARRTASSPGSWGAPIWLAWRQVRWFHAVILFVGLLIALFLLRTEPLAWPFFGMVLGVSIGLSAFAPDQLGGAARFLGDRRLPLDRLWLVKTALPLLSLGAIVLVVLMNIALMFAVRNRTEPHDMGIDLLASSGMILLGPVYGIAVGQFFGLVCRKGAVASVLSMLSSAGQLAVWLPSMIVGGLAIWQWLIPPLVLIAATRLAMRPWVAGRLSDWRPAMGIAGAGLLALGVVALGLWWRVIEVPAVSPPFDVAEFLASVPPPEKNEAGAKMRLAADQFGKHVDEKHLFARDPAVNPPFGTEGTYYSRALDASANDWLAEDAGLNDWMDEVFTGEWFGTLRAAVALPPGIVSLPWPPTTNVSSYPQFAQIGALLPARGLQLQARGKQDESFAMFRLALDTTRHLRPRTCVWQYHTVTAIELNVLRTLPLWAAKVGDRPDLLRQALVMLREGESALPPLTETIETEYVTELQRPLIVADPNESRFSRELREMARFTPWERERFEHIYNMMFAGWLRTANLSYRTALTRAEALGRPTTQNALLQSWLPAANDPDGARQREKLRQLLSTEHDLKYVGLPDFVFSQPYSLAHWRAAQLQIALLLYQKEHGRPAAQLADLTPAILPAVPIDPFDGGAPFHYRVSQGERIAMQPGRGDDDGMVAVEAGQGVVWSVSSDLTDDGGVRNGGSLGFGRGPPGHDLIFLVPVAGRR